MNSPKKFIRRGVVVDAMQYDGHNMDAIVAWLRHKPAVWPGNWLVYDKSDTYGPMTIWMPDAFKEQHEPVPEDAEAKARMNAAAPDLLAALESIGGYIAHRRKCALPVLPPSDVSHDDPEARSCTCGLHARWDAIVAAIAKAKGVQP